ncbi:MAG: LysR family transcriptional regulator [Myxococcales bacterium]|nr:LysR family transcriptional regulator [Myxococcales bacterium]
MINFNHLYYFHVTASEGSVKAAADRLGVTQPTVSEQIRMLERALGVQLFDRTASGLKLTQAGRDAYEHTTTMFLAGERLTETLAQRGAPPLLALRVGVSSAISRTVAADFLMPLLSVEHCRPSIRTADGNDLMRDLRAHELDLLVAESEPEPAVRQGLEVALIHKPVLIAIVAPDVEPRPDWQNLSLLEYRASSAYHWEVDAYLKERALGPSPAAELDDAFLMLEAVARGGFVAFVPHSVARDALMNGRVKTLATLPPATAISAVYHSGDTLHVARTAVEKLLAHARENLEPVSSGPPKLADRARQ